MDIHKINRLQLDIQYTENIDREEALPKSKALFETNISPVIEKLFNKYGPNTLRFNQISIDLGFVRKEDLENVLETKLFEALQLQVKNADINLNNDEKFEERIQDIILYYLKYGLLPWFEKNADEFNLSNGLRACAVDHDPEFKLKLLNLLQVAPQARLRLYNIPDLRFLLLLLYEFIKGLNHQLVEAIMDIKRTLELKESQKYFLIKRRVIIALYETILDNFTQVGSIQPSEFLNILRNHIPELKIARNPDFNSVYLAIAGYLSEAKEIKDKKPNIYPEFINPELFLPKNPISIKEDDRIYFSNSGLVLLYPFLASFFKTLGYINNKGVFNSGVEQQKAVHVLQYLVSGNKKYFDYSVTLNKLLCGIPPFYPIDMGIILTRKEKYEATELLNSVIFNWKALKSTSVKGLQETFINRKGLAEKSGGDWIVRVEHKTLDVLLETLPWSYSLLKLPWNNYIIYVEWNYRN